MLDRILGALVAISGTWILALGVVSSVWVQRQIFYAHRLPIWLGQQLDRPETFGYLKNQVLPLRITTSDGEKLYAWLVTPLKYYLKNEQALLETTPALEGRITRQPSFQLFSEDPNSRLIIYFHGNAGTVGQTRRTEAYRSITSGLSDPIHVLAFDYRGFGSSTGSPTEAGLVNDAIAAVRWGLEEAHVPPGRIALVGQSLGTGLVTAAAAHFLNGDSKIEFAGIILCAPFTTAAEVFQSYRLLGFIPLLAPLGWISSLGTWFASRVTDSWNTSDRLEDIIKKSSRLRLTLVHASSDNVIPCQMTEILFQNVARAVRKYNTQSETTDETQREENLGAGGSIEELVSGSKIIRKIDLRYGGHNNIMKWAPVAAEVARTFVH